MDTKSVVWTITETVDAEAQTWVPKMKENVRTPLWKKRVSHYLVADAASGEVNRWEGIRGRADDDRELSAGDAAETMALQQHLTNKIASGKKNIQCAWSTAQSIINSHLCRDRIDVPLLS